MIILRSQSDLYIFFSKTEAQPICFPRQVGESEGDWTAREMREHAWLNNPEGVEVGESRAICLQAF